MKKKIRLGLFALSLSALLPTLSFADRTGNICDVPGLASCPMPVDRNLPPVRDMLIWSQAQRLIGFRNDFRSYPGDVFKHGVPSPLPKSPANLDNASYIFTNKVYHLPDYIKRNDVTGLLVIKNGHIAYEYYGNGNNKTTLWTSRSTGKSIVSTLVGIAVKEGKIKSLDDKLTVYTPDLQKTAWADVTLRQLIQHTSGVAWDENYTDPASEFSKLTQCEAGPDTYNCIHDLVFNLAKKPRVAPGEEWSYSSGGAWLLGDILERATGMPIAKYLEEKVWKPFGMASDGVWHAYAKGRHDVGAHGFNATLEDWGRFGLFVMRGGALQNGKKLLPDNWLEEASNWTKARNSVSPAHPQGTYGYQWWNNSVPEMATDAAPKTGLSQNHTLWGLGIFGQMLVVDPKENLVIVQWSTWEKAEPSFSKEPLEASLMFNAIANALK